WLGELNVRTNAEGVAEFTLEVRDVARFVPGGYVVATAFSVGAREGTSELSAPIAFDVTPRMFEVTTVADRGAGSLRDAIESVNATPCTRSAPCRITFHVAEEEVRNRAAIIEPASPLPALAREFVSIEGSTQEYWTGAREDAKPAVEIVGAGLRIGSAEAPLSNISLRGVAV